MWQPIETAPKDGTEIIVWCGDRAAAVFWAENQLEDEGRETWMLSYDGADPLWHARPTHWMPLPEAPE